MARRLIKRMARNFFLKLFKVSQFRISRGIEFHTAGAATANLRSANFVRVRGTVSADTSVLDRKSRTDLQRTLQFAGKVLRLLIT